MKQQIQTISPPDDDELKRIIHTALAEDVGNGDITSQLLVPADLQARMHFIAKQELVVCGGFIPQAVFAAMGQAVAVEVRMPEASRTRPGDVIAIANGPARALLGAERVTLNLMQRMSGVATLTHRFVEAVAGTKAKILDTRKTMPGLRALDKYAVRVGGGQNHRMRLDDMVLIKDNHIALCGGIAMAVEKARKGSGLQVVVECDTLEQVVQALAAKPDRILLDNMTIAQLQSAVKLNDGKIPLEASGGVSFETIRAIAETGVDYISVGSITHSAPAADISGDIKTRS
jgi:nicotinate-nucleotide pyrophosphorylase (carboxylating)